MKATSPRTDTLSLNASVNGAAFSIERLDGFAIAASWVDWAATSAVVPAAAVNTAANTFTLAAHGLQLAQKVQVTTSGTLPAPLLVATDYYIIPVDANTFKVATSSANALAGTAIDITTQGIGNTTFTSSATLSGTFRIQVSNNALLDNTNQNPDPNAQWDDISGSTVSAAGTGQQMWNVSNAFYKAARIVWTSTTGQGTATVRYHGKGVI